MNSILAMITDTNTRLTELSERTAGSGITFEDLTFASESDFADWYLKGNPSGSGLAGFVDFVSIWGFADTAYSQVDWLNQLQKSKNLGLKGALETTYAHSMTVRYPPHLFGSKVEHVNSNQKIKILDEIRTWRGNGRGDGHRERLYKDLRMALKAHARYCRDFLPSGPIQDAAIRTGEATNNFFHGLTVYINDELAMFKEHELNDKESLVLMSSQVVQIGDEIHNVHHDAASIDLDNRAATGIRYAWVSLQAQACMAEFVHDGFRDHKGINSSTHAS